MSAFDVIVRKRHDRDHSYSLSYSIPLLVLLSVSFVSVALSLTHLNCLLLLLFTLYSSSFCFHRNCPSHRLCERYASQQKLCAVRQLLRELLRIDFVVLLRVPREGTH